ncbi:hypothetical protein AURDEDRAFT_155285 [Auricularia subglabra TFB-10046 SS5]|nr:hypothetical protein AURDEDRAFT_155285 [Auricularia subglabra TFB-10046 SS5]
MLLARLVSRARMGTRALSGLRAHVDVQPDVAEALARGAPVVALESALVTDGMPPPHNLNVARACETLIRQNGAVPATICMLDGRVKVGLSDAELQRIADTEAGNSAGATKISRRDFAPAIALKRSGGTTIAGTMVVANLVGIKVFATGGLGGVHRNGQNSLDISADLTELGRTPVGVIASGIKSILDIPRTLEYLARIETQGVPVLTYADNNVFPAFYARDSGCKSPWNVNTPELAAQIFFNQFNELQLQTGVFFAAPVPERAAADGVAIQKAIDQAVRESEENGMSARGKDVTPWLLRRVTELTHGGSLQSNIALIENTSVIGAQVAVQYAKLVKEAKADDSGAPNAELLVVGCAAVDIIAQQTSTVDAAGSTAPGRVRTALGGVARNVSEAAHRLSSSSVVLVAPIGSDAFGTTLRDGTAELGMRVDGFVAAETTPVCNMLLDAGGALVCGVADMDAPVEMSADEIIGAIERYAPRLVALDANLSPDAIARVLAHCRMKSIPTFFEPTSVAKAGAILPAFKAWAGEDGDSDGDGAVTLASPNARELAVLADAARAHDLLDTPKYWRALDRLGLEAGYRQHLALLAGRPASASSDKGDLGFLLRDGIVQNAVALLPFVRHLMVQLGDKGVLVAMRPAAGSVWDRQATNIAHGQVVAHGGAGAAVVLRHFPALDVAPHEVVSVTGAGDSLVGAVLAGLLANPRAFCGPDSLDALVMGGQRAAVETLRSSCAVAPVLSRFELCCS